MKNHAKFQECQRFTFFILFEKYDCHKDKCETLLRVEMNADKEKMISLHVFFFESNDWYCR